MAAWKLADSQRRGRADNRRNDRRQTASVGELRVQDGIVFVEPFAKLVGDHFEAGTEFARVEGHGCFTVNDPVALVPPRGVGIAHDFADALVKQERLDGAEKRKDQFKTHSGCFQRWKPSVGRASGSGDEEAYSASSSGLSSSSASSSGVDFSARSSFRMDVARTSQIRCFTSLCFLSVNSRLTNSPSIARCEPFWIFLANSPSLPQTMTRCHSVRLTYSPVFLSLYEDCVATDSTVYAFWLLVVRASASLPVNPMSETLLRYMMISSVFELLICSGHTGRSLAQGPAPKAKTRFLWRV